MTQVQEDIISRLQVAITDWKAEVTASQEGLMQQIAGAAVQLDNLAGILTGRPTPSIEEPEHLNALARQLIDRDEIVEAQRGRIAEFESLLTELREEIEMLRPLDAQNQALNEELTVLRSSAETASRRLDEARAKIVSLEIETLEKAALADSQPSAEELQETVSALLQQLEDQEAQAQTVKDELTRQIETLQLESEAYLERLLEVQTRADTLEAELATRKADAERETAELRQTVVDLQGELGLLRQQEADSVGRDALVEELNRVRQEAETGVASLAEARVRITALEQELLERSRPPVPDPAVLEQAVERLEGELRTLRQCETARLDANESLAADLRRLQEELRAKERALAESRKEAQSLHAELTARPAVEDVSRIRELEELATALRGEVETLRFGKAQAIEANEALESEIAALKNALAECYASLVYPQTDPAQVAEGVHQIEMDLERLRAEAEQVSEVNRNLARELSLIQAKREVELQRNDAARDKIARLEQSLAARDAEVEAQVRRLAALENRVAELEPALQSLAVDKEAADRQLDAARSEIGRLEKTLTARTAETERLTQRAAELDGAAQKLKAEFNTLRIEKETNARHAAAALDDVKRLSEQLEAREGDVRSFERRVAELDNRLCIVEPEAESLRRDKESNQRQAAAAQGKLEWYERILGERDAEARNQARRLTELEYTVREFKPQLESLRNERDAKAQQVSSAREEIIHLRELLTSRESATEGQSHRVTELEQRLATLEPEYEALRTQKETLVRRLAKAEAQAEELERTLHARTADMKTRTQQASELEQRAADLDSELKSIRAEKSKAIQNLTDAHIEIERLNRQLAARDASVADYARRVAELDDAQQDFDRQVRALRKEQDAAKTGQIETLERCRQLEETLAARDSALRSQSGRTAEIEQRARELQQTVEQLRRDKIEAGAQLVEARATTEQFQQSLSAREQQAEADTRRIAELEQNLDRIRVELETSRLQRESEARELADARSEIARLQQRLAAHSTKALTDDGRVGELTQTMDRLSDESESLRAENNRMARDLADATAQIASLKQALSSATSGEAIERIQAELDTVKSEGRRAAGRVREADAKTKQIEQRLTQVQTELRDARALNESLQEELDEAHGGGTSSVSELREALIEIESLKDMLAERDRTALAATQHIVQLGQTVTRLENELNTIRSQEGNAGEIAAQLKAARADNETKLKALALAQAEMQSLSEALARSRESGASGEELAKTLHKYAELQEQARVLQETNRKLQQRVDGVEDDKKTRRRQNRIALEALDSQGRSRKMGEILHAAGVITEAQLKDALGEQKAMPDRLLGTILLEKGYVDEHDIAQVVSSQLQVPFMPLYPETVGPEAAGLLDGKFCMWHMCVPLRATSELLVVAMANPLDSAALEKIESASTRRVVPVVATPSDITVIIETLFGSY